MRKICVHFLVLFLYAHHAWGSDSQVRPSAIPFEKIVKAVVYLSGEAPKVQQLDGVAYELGARRLGSEAFELLTDSTAGTGFFVRKGDRLYLVTAAHVAKGFILKTSIVASGENGIQQAYPIKGKLNWFFSEKADAAVAHIDDPILVSAFANNALDASFISQEEAAPGREFSLVVVGFPLSLGVGKKVSPLFRETHAASGLLDQKRADNGQQSTFFIMQDPSVAGYSGAPVFLIETSRFAATLRGSYSPNLCVGIVHGTKPDNTGGKLGMVTPASYVRELIERVHQK